MCLTQLATNINTKVSFHRRWGISYKQCNPGAHLTTFARCKWNYLTWLAPLDNFLWLIVIHSTNETKSQTCDAGMSRQEACRPVALQHYLQSNSCARASGACKSLIVKRASCVIAVHFGADSPHFELLPGCSAGPTLLSTFWPRHISTFK